MPNLIPSNSLNYPSEIESLFSAFLRSSGASGKTITNYLSDLRSFLTWHAASDEKGQNCPSDAAKSLSTITDATMKDYKASLLLSRTPAATINRRLSALRMFFQFAATKNLIASNPLEDVKNVKIAKEQAERSILEDFTAYMSSQGASEKTKANYRVDINHFLTWIRKSSNFPHHSWQRGNSTDQELLSHTGKALIEEYIQDQNHHQTPVATINRRLSALRMMYQFLTTSCGLISSPIEAVKNLSSDPMKAFAPLIKSFCNQDTDPTFTKEEKIALIEDFISWRTSPA